MIGAAVRRGLLAGLVAGTGAGLVGLFLGEPALGAAVALEGRAAGGAGGLSRVLQLVGLVVGLGLVGLAVGAAFGVAAIWSVGRVAGDVWARSVKLGAVALAAVVLLPALRYPPDPPGAGGGGDVGTRVLLSWGVALLGLVLAAAAWAAGRQLAATALPVALRQTLVGLGVLAAAGLAMWVLPDAGGTAGSAVGEQAELVWRFRLGSIATQAALYGGTAVLYGLLAARSARPAGSRVPS